MRDAVHGEHGDSPASEEVKTADQSQVEVAQLGNTR